MKLFSGLHLGSVLLVVVILFDSSFACETIGSWNALVAAVKSAAGSLNLCPFDISKPESEWLVLNKRLAMTCVGATNNNKCTVRGTGHHFRIVGAAAEVVLNGFAFYDATKCAVRVLSTATKEQEIRNCDFISNAGQFMKWRGGAIKTELSTNVTISKSNFIGNTAGGGGAIFHRGDSLVIKESSFRDNLAKGGAVFTDTSSFLGVYDSSFVNNTATIFDGGAIVATDSTSLTDIKRTVGNNNAPCNGVYTRTSRSCDTNTFAAPTSDPFVPGELTSKQEGLRLSTGLTVKVLARAGEPVEFTSPERASPKSAIDFHGEPDGAAVFELDDGGWVYMSNSELPSKEGGVFALEFDKQGRPRSYTQRLNSTSRNCAGGVTPWNTWVSCEEHANGHCWQVHPTGAREPEKTKLVESAGGNFESMAVDNRDANRPVFFVTEDHERGALRRFTPSPCDQPPSWDMIHHEGTIDYLEFLPNNKFQWTRYLQRGRDSAFLYFRNVEGISHDNGILSFVAKKQREIFHLDLDAGTYTKESTNHQALAGGGSFGAQPDQLLLFSDVLYFTEDGGRSPGIYADDGSRLYALVEGFSEDYHTDETTGFAFSPDGTKLYFCIQEIGHFFQLERKDGLPFNYSRRLLGLRYHRV